MNKTHLVDTLTSETGVSKSQASRAIDCIVLSITAALRRREHVVLSGFGSFSVYQRKARNGRNPQTGAIIKIKSRQAARFSAGSDLNKAINRAKSEK
jgi:DNA-binding protein HU-beta